MTPSMPWEGWEAGNLVPKAELDHHHMPTYPKVVYVRHLHKATIRCALMNVTGCQLKR